ncbi:MAG: nucleotidyltransferase family protein [Acidimicrobiales bacterium]
MTVAAVVLAAGEGRRFVGTSHKLLASFRGRAVVTWSVGAALEAGLDETVVVTGAVELAEHLGPGLTVLQNKAWASGQASSLRVAMDWCTRQGHAAAVIGLGDQPLVPAAAWAAVGAAASSPIVTATFAGKRRPPVRLDASVWPMLPVDGDEGARVLMRTRPELVSEVACDGDPVDIDTVEDLKTCS